METQRKPSLGTASADASALPHSLDILSDCLAKFIPPEGPFDPRGNWDHRYAVWIALRVDASHEHGALRIRRAVGASGGVTLSISQRIGPTVTNTTGHTTASVTLSPRNGIEDRLATPGKWEIDSRILNAKGDSVPYSKTRVTGEVSQGSIAIRTQAERKLKAPKAFTGNWSLFDAVQRLPFDTDPIEFEMLLNPSPARNSRKRKTISIIVATERDMGSSRWILQTKMPIRGIKNSPKTRKCSQQ